MNADKKIALLLWIVIAYMILIAWFVPPQTNYQAIVMVIATSAASIGASYFTYKLP